MWRKDKYYVLHGMTLNWWFTTRLFIRFIRKIRVRFKKVLNVLSVLFYTKNLHKGGWLLRVNQ